MMLTLGPWARSAGVCCETFESIGSTNAEALARARNGERGPKWFATTMQTRGRGRRNREWIAPRGNLASTILEVIDVTPATAATLGFAAGVALAAALRQVSGETVERSPPFGHDGYRLKWPNDILAGGRKLAGILVEVETVADGRLAVALGIGANVVAAPDIPAYPATSLAALGVPVTADDLFVALSDCWTQYRGVWDNGRGFQEIRRLWLDRAAGLGETVSIKTGSTVISGVFDTIDDAGCMIIVTAAGGRVPVSAGDVYFGTAASAK